MNGRGTILDMSVTTSIGSWNADVTGELVWESSAGVEATSF